MDGLQEAAYKARLEQLQGAGKLASFQDSSSEGEEALFRRLFNEIDSDRGGTIDLKEWNIFLKKLDVVVEPEDVKLSFDFLDRDGGGVEFGELMWAYNNRRSLVKGNASWDSKRRKPTASKTVKQTSTKKKCRDIVARDPTYVVKIKPRPKPQRQYDNGAVGVFQRAMDKIREHATKQGKQRLVDLAPVFEHFDRSGDGIISYDELLEALRSIGVELSNEEYEVVYYFFDRDGGGVDYGEFSWVFYNRRLVESALGQTKEIRRGTGDAKYQHWLEKEVHQQAEDREEADRLARQANHFRTIVAKEKAARINNPPQASVSPQQKPGFVTGGVFRSPLENPRREPYSCVAIGVAPHGRGGDS